MEPYTKAHMEIIPLAAEDIVTVSGSNTCSGMDTSIGGWGCGTDDPGCPSYCWEFEVS